MSRRAMLRKTRKRFVFGQTITPGGGASVVRKSSLRRTTVGKRVVQSEGNWPPRNIYRRMGRNCNWNDVWMNYVEIKFQTIRLLCFVAIDKTYCGNNWIVFMTTVLDCTPEWTEFRLADWTHLYTGRPMSSGKHRICNKGYREIARLF